MKFSKLIKILVATICIGSGVGFILAADIGSDSISVLQDGIHNVLTITYGQASLLYNIVLISAALLIARKYFGSGSVISALLTGTFIDLAYAPAYTFVQINLQNQFVFRFIFFILGLIIYSIGLATLISCKLGMNSLDSILTMISDKTKIQYQKLRIIADLFLTLIGWLMHGVIGIGTVLSILFTGTLIHCFTDFIDKLCMNELEKARGI